MSLISSCPACSRYVSVPLDVSPQATVRCPLCQAEFSLLSALELLPPALEVVSLPVGTAEMAGVAVAEDAGHGSGLLSGHSRSQVGLRGMDAGLPFSEGLTFDAPSLEDETDDIAEPDTELEGIKPAPSLDDLMAEAPFSSQDFQETSPNPFKEDLPFEEATTEDNGELDLRESPEETSPYALGGPITTEDALEFDATFDATAASDGSPSTAPPFVSGALRRKKEPSMIGTLIGVVGGGLMAIPIALFIVLWIGGPEKDFAGIADYLPKILLPPSFSKQKLITAPVVALPNNPSPAELAEVKKAASDGGFGAMELNVPALPEKPAEESLSPASEDAGDIAADLAGDQPLIDPISPPSDQPVLTGAESAESMEEETTEDRGKPRPLDTADAEEMPASKETLSTEVGPIDAVTYQPADLESAISDVKKLAAKMQDSGALEKAAANKIKGQFYRKLYRLGEVATFVEGDADTDLAEQYEAIAGQLAELGSSQSKIDEIGSAAGKWLSLPAEKRTAEKGVLLAGTVLEASHSGNMHRLNLMLAGKGEPISVYSAKDSGAEPGDIVLVLGSVIVNPQETLHNFTEDESTVVWQGLTVKLPASE